jgi:hypothetical protein
MLWLWGLILNLITSPPSSLAGHALLSRLTIFERLGRRPHSPRRSKGELSEYPLEISYAQLHPQCFIPSEHFRQNFNRVDPICGSVPLIACNS